MGGWHASQDKLTQPARGNLCTYRHVCGSPGHQQSHPLPPSPLSCRRTHLRSWLLWAVVPLGLPLLARPLSSRRWLPLPVLALAVKRARALARLPLEAAAAAAAALCRTWGWWGAAPSASTCSRCRCVCGRAVCSRQQHSPPQHSCMRAAAASQIAPHLPNSCLHCTADQRAGGGARRCCGRRC